MEDADYNMQRKFGGYDAPLKIEVFMWLISKKAVQTWDNLQRRGWESPDYCVHRSRNKESVDYFMLFCTFTRFMRFGCYVKASAKSDMPNI